LAAGAFGARRPRGALQQLGRHREACRPFAIAACLRPERSEYRAYL